MERIRSNPLLSAAAVAAGAWILWILLLPAHAWSKHISNLGLTVMPLVAAVQCARQAAGCGGSELILERRMTAWVRLSTPSFCSTAETCALMVASDTPSS